MDAPAVRALALCLENFKIFPRAVCYPVQGPSDSPSLTIAEHCRLVLVIKWLPWSLNSVSGN